MPAALVLVALCAAATVAYLLLRPVETAPPDRDDANPVTTPTPERHIPTPTTGTLIIRVRTPDSMPLPHDTRAGYLDGPDRRMRPAAPDGTFRFSDAPLGRVEVVAEASGYREGTGIASVTAGVPEEVVVMLGAKP